jgi:hypothetical protein
VTNIWGVQFIGHMAGHSMKFVSDETGKGVNLLEKVTSYFLYFNIVP